MNIRKIIRQELSKVLIEGKAYSSDQITNNELASYITILSNNLVAAKSRNNQELVDSLTKDIEEVKQELSNRKNIK